LLDGDVEDRLGPRSRVVAATIVAKALEIVRAQLVSAEQSRRQVVVGLGVRLPETFGPASSNRGDW
jgi:hypothetical protein